MGRGILAAIFLPHLSLLPQTSSASPWEDRAGCQNSGRRLALASLTTPSSQAALISLPGAPTHHLHSPSSSSHVHTHREPHGSSPSLPLSGRNLGQGTRGRAEGADVPQEAVGGTKNRAWGGAPDPAWGRPPHRSRAVNTDTACLFHSPGKCLQTEVMLLSGLG